MTTQRDNRSTRRRQGLVMPVLVAVIAGAVTLAMVLTPFFLGSAVSDSDASGDPTATSERGQPDDPEAGESGDMLDDLPRRDPDDAMALGRADAPVVMVEYSDFQCPFCGRFARDTAPDLVARYVDEGILRMEWRDFPYLGEESMTAALAGRAAAAQDRFWAFHDELYANALPPNSGEMTEDYLVGIARDVGLDAQRLREDMRSSQAKKGVQRDFREAQEIGVTGTPAFIVNGDPIMGAQPLSVFVDAVEKAAADAR